MWHRCGTMWHRYCSQEEKSRRTAALMEHPLCAGGFTCTISFSLIQKNRVMVRKQDTLLKDRQCGGVVVCGGRDGRRVWVGWWRILGVRALLFPCRSPDLCLPFRAAPLLLIDWSFPIHPDPKFLTGGAIRLFLVSLYLDWHLVRGCAQMFVDEGTSR